MIECNWDLRMSMIPIGDDDSSNKIIPVVNWALMAINVLVFLIEVTEGDAYIVRWSFIPIRFVSDPIEESLTIFSSMFMHAGLLHIGGNMLYLWIFGNNVENSLGHIRYLLFYLISGVAATLTQLYFSLGSDVPNLGASGAIAGVLGAYLLMFPWKRVKVLLGRFIVRLPAFVVLGFWFVLQFFSGVGSVTDSSGTGGVAYMAHIGGFAAGFVMALLLGGKSYPGSS
jgi:membrane associated rhomboid family serine protease